MTDEANKTGQPKNRPTHKRDGTGGSPGNKPKRPTLSLDKDKQEALRKAMSQTENATSTQSDPEDMGEDDIKAPTPLEQIADLTLEVDDLKKQLLLSRADIQNLHKRFERERAETSKYAISNFARDIVAVVDNFERAISSVPEGAPEENEGLKSLLDGVTIAEREFLNILERHGIKRINPVGELFDPHKHQAMMEQEDKSVAAGTILQVVQCGYLISDRMLRPAMVLVAKGGEKPVRSAKSDVDEAADAKSGSENQTTSDAKQDDTTGRDGGHGQSQNGTKDL